MAAPDFVTSTLYSETAEPLRIVRPRISREVPRSAMPVVEAIADFFVCTMGLLATSALCTLLPAGIPVHSSIEQMVGLGVAFGVATTFLLHRDGAYRGCGGLLRIRTTERALRSTLQALLFLLLIGSLLGQRLAWPEFVLAAVAVPMLLFFERLALFRIERSARNRNGVQRVVIYGAGETGRRAVSTLLQSPRLKLEPAAVIDDSYARAGSDILEMGYRGRGSVPLHHGAVTPSLLRSFQCDLLMMARPDLPADKLAAALDAADQLDLEVAFLDGPYAAERTESFDMDGVALTTTREYRESWFYSRAKRMLDVVASSSLLFLLSPLLLLIAILIRLDSPGPALFIQKRVGRDGEFFDIYKFRSMYVGAAKYASSPTSSKDPRITRAGRILRRLSLDELPQLINVLKGTMTLVGPRPEMPFIVERYDARQRQRLGVTPGVTGLWQLSADRSFPIHDNIEYDLYYIRHRSFSIDVAILIHTLVFAMCGGI